ncbi:cytochrome d ubiquinol oxidase subunit II [Streptomyces albiaxialis]|uniref:Cytochrome d ubiquinol oxidase subunit II n=1 Tax=Streptomyces albiaxialis TaxID=329523 RepID=A0ABP5IAR1_9ACTN
MTLESVWLALLGLLLGGYFVLGGYDYGVQMLALRPGGEKAGHEKAGQRDTVSAMAPFFLGNEVWLVAFVGVLFGAFPHLEGHLLSGLYPVFAALVLGLVLGGAAVQLRGRARGAGAHRVWSALLVLGGALPALCWGLVLGLLTRGVPRRADGSFHIGPDEVLHPYVLACGLAAVLLFAAHGATFLALRGGPELADGARRTARTLLRATLAAAVLPALLTLAGAGAALRHPGTASVLLALLLAALAATRWLLAGRGTPGRAFAVSCCAALLPVPLLGAGQYPYVLAARGGGGITVGEAAADEVTLRTLLAFGVVLVPVILAYQAWNWWVFRGRTGLRHPRYF